jgi:ABC-type uncharacterized transport system ATPase subunit
MPAARAPLLSARGITKIYPGGVVANDNVSLDIYLGEVLALLGENGAGKTTLVSILAGYQKPDRGEILFEGERVEFSSPRDAMRKGIVLVQQHPKLIEAFTVAENIVLAYRLAGRGRLGIAAARRLVREYAEKYGLHVDPDRRVRSLTMGERQRAEIIKALVLQAKLLLLDEPTTHLSPVEVEGLAMLVRELAEEGRSVVVITHRIKEALAVADRVAVMRRGRLVGVLRRDEATVEKLIELMFGKAMQPPPPRHSTAKLEANCVIRVEDLYVYDKPTRSYVVSGVSICVRPGEIVGVAGIAGNGQRELFEALVGLRRPARGRIEVGGVDVTSRGPGHRGRLGLAIVPEDRLGWALVRGKSLVFNIAVGFYSSPRGPYRGVLVDWRRAREVAEEVRRRFSVKADSVETIVDALSGGNMQRFIIGREVLKAPRALIAMNPTAGLDYDATMYVRRLLVELAERDRVGILLISEDLEELMELADEIAVMSRGRIVYRAKPPYNVDAIARAMVGAA